MKQWFQGLLSTDETFAYYLAQFIESGEMGQTDTIKPMLVVSSTFMDDTDQPIEIKVQANDRSGIAQMKWTAGKEAADSAVWAEAANITRGCFVAEKMAIILLWQRISTATGL